MGSVPSTFATGYKYAGMGYTTAFDAAIPPLGARHAHEEFDDTPCIDKGFYVLMGNNHYVMQSHAAERAAEAEGVHRLAARRDQGLRAEARESRRRRSLEEPSGRQRSRPRRSRSITSTSRRGRSSAASPRRPTNLRLPHPVHIHCNNLGMPGNWQTTLETMKALEGHRGHITHIQFHSYGGGEGDENTFNSKVVPLAEYVNSHPNVTVDVGQVLFGETTSMTGDGPLGYYLSNVFKRQVVQRRHRNGIRLRHHAHQVPEQVARPRAAMGDRPGVVPAGRRPVARRDEHRSSQRRLVPGLPADHPPADGPHLPAGHAQEVSSRRFASARRSAISTANTRSTKSPSSPAPARRESSASRTRAISGPGADADITIYTPHENKETMFELPRTVIKSGRVMIEHGEIRDPLIGKTLHVAPDYDHDVEADIQDVVREVLLDPLAQLPGR